MTTKSGNHKGVSYFIDIKHSDGKYKATSKILFSTHIEAIYWNDHPMILAVEKSATKGGKNYFYVDPTELVTSSTIGTIDGVLELIAESANGNERSANRLNALIQEADLKMQKMRPDTNPTDEQLAQMKEQVMKLVDTFTASGIAAIAGITRQTVQGWISRGRISAQAAHAICQLPEVSSRGFTRESMRPDVKFWYIN